MQEKIIISCNKITMIYERVAFLLNFFALSKAQWSRELGLTQKTSNGYFCEKNQHNLWQHLPRLLEMYPRVSRQWLYFGEGPMLIGYGIPLDEPVPLQAIAEAVEAMGKDAGGTQGDLLRYIAGIPLDESQREVLGGTVQLEEIRSLNAKVLELYAELNEVRRELDKSRQATIAAYEEQRGQATMGRAAHGISNAAPFKPHGNENKL